MSYSGPSNKAVKAIVYRDDGRILMQQRDSLPGLPFAGCWTFFGGLVEQDESLHEALERELIEEIGCVPGYVEKELFLWEWRSDWFSTYNHFIPVHCENDTNKLVQHEGQSMEWFLLEELVDIPLTPAIYENFSKLASFLNDLCPDIDERLENRLLEYNDLVKKNDRVFYARKNPCGISRQQIFIVKELALLRNIQVFRICLHIDDSHDIHEMLMVHTKPTSVGPLRQNKTSLSYHIMEGDLKVNMHDKTGALLDEFILGNSEPSNQGLISLRLNASEYRSVHSTSDFAIFMEVASGPFKDSDTEWLKH